MQTIISRYLIVFILGIFIFACEKDSIINDPDPSLGNPTTWKIDTNDLSATEINNSFQIVINPEYIKANTITKYEDNEKMIVFKIDTSVFVYPISKMGLEVVNDSLGDLYFCVTYCPITKSSYVINRNIGSEIYTFAPSGILYKNNLVFYDVKYETLWSQMLMEKIKGNFVAFPDLINSFETEWINVKNYFPNSNVFEDWENSNTKNERVNNSINSNNPGDFGFIVVKENITKYSDVIAINITQIQDKSQLLLFNDIAIVYQNNLNIIQSFSLPNNLTFELKDNFPTILTDSEGSDWDIFGYAISGPRKGEQASFTRNYLAMWWAIELFHEPLYVIE